MLAQGFVSLWTILQHYFSMYHIGDHNSHTVQLAFLNAVSYTHVWFS